MRTYVSLVICRAVNLSLEGGNCDASCYAYAVLGRLAGPEFGDYQAGFRFGRLGYELVEKRGLKRFQARTYLNFGYWRHVLGRDMSGKAAICCGARSRRQTRSVTSLLRRTTTPT